MSREIKFRVWDNHNKKMVQPYVEFNNFNPEVVLELVMLLAKAVSTVQKSSQGGGVRRSTRRRRRSTKKKVASKKRKQTRRRT